MTRRGWYSPRLSKASFSAVFVAGCAFVAGCPTVVTPVYPSNFRAAAEYKFRPCHLPAGKTDADVLALAKLPEGLPFSAQVQVVSAPLGNTVANEAEVDGIMCELRTTPLVKSDENWVPMRYDQILNDCQNRAEVAVAYLADAHPGMILGKVFVSGNLDVCEGQIGWGFHVAPYTVAKDSAGQPFIAVLDPAIDSSKSVRLVDWLAAVSGKASVKVFLTSPQTWGFAGTEVDGKPMAPAEDEKQFCNDRDSAAAYLGTFESRINREMRWVPDVTISSISPNGVVSAKKKDGKVETMCARRDIARYLKNKGNQQLDVCWIHEHTKDPIKDLFRDKTSVIYFAQGQPGVDHCPAAADAECLVSLDPTAP